MRGADQNDDAPDSLLGAEGPTGPHKNHKHYLVPGLVRGLEMLQVFSHAQPSLRLSALARKLGISQSSAFRIAYTLTAMGFIERDAEANSYRLSSRVLNLGFEYLASTEIVDVARPVLEALRDRTGLSAHLATLDATDALHLLRAPSRGALTSNVSVGARRPAHANALGRALLIDHTPADLAALYAERPLPKVTEHTPATLAQLERVLAEDRRRGYAASWGSYIPGAFSLAAPVRDAAARIVAAINIAGPQELTERAEFEPRYSGALLAAAAEISERMGYKGEATERRGPDRTRALEPTHPTERE